MEKTNGYKQDAFNFSKGKHEKEKQLEFNNISYGRDVLNRFLANKAAVISAVIIGIIILIAIIAPVFSGISYKKVNPLATNLPPRIPGLEKLGVFNGLQDGVNVYVQKNLQSRYFLFGTDNLGRDIWTRVWQGTRISLYVALLAVLIDIGIGVLYGLISGYTGGWVDTIMQRITEVLSSIPTMVVVTLMLIVMKPGLLSITLALVMTGWINMSRIVRAQVFKLKDQEFVMAAKTCGSSKFSIIFHEILPNTLGQIVVTFMFSIPNAIFLEAFLSFIGLGVPAPMASLGSLISDGYKSAMTYPYMIFAPVIVLGLLMLCFNLFADGLRDAVDPQMKQM